MMWTFMKVVPVEKEYRQWIKHTDLISFQVKIKETDILLSSERLLEKEAVDATWKYRNQIESYIKRDQGFLESLNPYPVKDFAPAIVKEMAEAGGKADVGPMAAVAGAIAEYVGRDLLNFSDQVILENGGDIFLRTRIERKVAIFSESSKFARNVAIEVNPERTPIGICTSSGKIGHSFSFGRADSVTILSKSAALADAVATAVGNLVSEGKDIQKGIYFCKTIEEVEGVIIIIDDQIGIWGDIKLIEV
jgi:ApbE superfamily uncharacterized protein (UPF0280 family)